MGETDDKYNIAITIQMISSDKLQIIIQWFPPPGQGHPPVIAPSLNNDKLDEVFAKTRLVQSS